MSKLKITKEQRTFLEQYFDYIETDYNDNDLYLETWTNGGVDMVIYLDKNKSLIENLEEYIESFDIDEEIEIYRQDQRYKQNFTIRESVNDFENWVVYITNIINELKEVE